LVVAVWEGTSQLSTGVLCTQSQQELTGMPQSAMQRYTQSQQQGTSCVCLQPLKRVLPPNPLFGVVVEPSERMLPYPERMLPQT
jgi:hypothetical protein